MYTLYPKLSEENITELKALKGELNFVESKAQRRRMGENGLNRASWYLTSRSFTWLQEQRARFAKLVPEKQVKNSLVSWFVEYPAKTGFLDRMTYWVDKTMAGTVIVYALDGDYEILIENKRVVVPRGEGIGFSLRLVHEIKESKAGQLWACMMVLGDPENFKV